MEELLKEEQVFQELTKKEKTKRFLKSQEGWLFVLPAVILMCVFTFYPIVSTFIQAFMENYNPLNKLGKTYTGWGVSNFVNVVTANTGTNGAEFGTCLKNTLLFTFISVPASTFLALIISVALNSIKWLQKAYQTVFFLPYLTNALAMGAVFATFFKVVGTKSSTEQIGLVNSIIQLFGGKPIQWFGYTSALGNSNQATRTLVMVVYEIWSGLPFKILILFSSLQSVNKQYFDAAKVDGASKSTILWKITTPLISPMVSYLLITGIMGGMKQYTAVVGIFGSKMGDNYEMGTMVGYIYYFLNAGKTGYAAAGSLILFAIIMVITVINLKVSKKRTFY